MAEKKKYNSILISGRKDQTLTYSKYVKDEESGESVKESLDKKVNVTDELTTQQIKDGAITNEKMAADSVGNTNLQDGSVSNEKLEDGSITNEKLAENSITKDKLQDKTIGVEKLDNELRQTIAAATGLPEDLVETIQNVDDTLKDHQSQLDDKQSQIDDKQQQITANDEDISLLQTRSTQMEETIKSIAATGGASQATAVTYNNANSQLTATNIQSAVDELQGSKINKTSIAHGLGDSKNKVMSQKAVSDKFSDSETEMIHFSGCLNGMIPKEKYTKDVMLLNLCLVRVEYENVVDLTKLNQAYITYGNLTDDYDGTSGSTRLIRMEIMYDNKAYLNSKTSISTTTEDKLTYNFDDGTTISLVVLYPVEALHQSFYFNIVDYKIGFNKGVRNTTILKNSSEISSLKAGYIHLQAPFNGIIPKNEFSKDISSAFSCFISVKFSNVANQDKINNGYLTWFSFEDKDNKKEVNFEYFYDGKYYNGNYNNIIDYTEKEITLDDGTIITVGIQYPKEFIGINSTIVDVRKYKIGFKEDLTVKEISKIEANKGREIVKNIFGYCNRQFTYNVETPIRQDITYKDEYYNIKLSRVAETSDIGVWNSFQNVPIIKGHKYVIITKYRINSNNIRNLGGLARLTYYFTASKFSTYVQLRTDDSSDDGYWKYSISEGLEFTALTDGGIMDVVFTLNYKESFTAETLDFDIDIIPIVLDVTYTNLRDGAFIEYFEKFGVVYDSLIISKASIISLNSNKSINMVTLGDSTTGMMMWQDKLARLKGWNWNMKSNGGYEVDGKVRAAMGVGSTWVEPIITGTTGGMQGNSHYMRAKDVKYYKPDILFVMSSYNGASSGTHWADNNSYPIQPEDCGINDEPYKGEEVDLTKNPSAVVPSFGASYYGMIEQLVTDLPNTQIVLLNLTSDFAGANKNSLEKKNAVIKKAAEKYNLLMLNVDKEAGFNEFNKSVLRYDGGVHFNEAGGMRLAMYIALKIGL